MGLLANLTIIAQRDFRRLSLLFRHGCFKPRFTYSVWNQTETLVISNFLTFSKKPLDPTFHEKLCSIQCCSLDNNETIKIESAFSAVDKSSSVSSRHIQYTRTILDFMRQGQS